MQRSEAARFCDELNGIDQARAYVADVANVSSPRMPGYPAALIVRHVASGNEIAYAVTADEARHVIRGIRRRVGAEAAQ